MSKFSKNLQINVQRIESDLKKLAEFDTEPEKPGVTRQGFSEQDWLSRQWLCKYFSSNGLTASIDGAGNVCGRIGPVDKPAVVIGSHSDSVPEGGLFDGTLGVIAGLECVRVIQENSIDIQFPIEIIATSEEEGRFGGMLGSQALTGQLSLEWMQSASDLNGYSLEDALKSCGLSFDSAISAKRDPKTIKAFLELHIEQGPVLENAGDNIGIVKGISGIFKYDITLKGSPDHSGTTPMGMRRDAFIGLANFASQLNDIVMCDGTIDTRLTIGEVDVKPGYAHTIPGEVKFTLVGRDLSEAIMYKLKEGCLNRLQSIADTQKLELSYEESSWLCPQSLNSDLIELIRNQSEKLAYSYQIMPSGAGHDAQFFSTITPTGLIFIPSVAGLSHSPHEFSHWSDVERGTNLLLHSLLDLVT